jgi:predicted O-methyltransferase YrrM
MRRKLARAGALVRNFARSRVSPLLWLRALNVTRGALRKREAMQKSSEFAPFVSLVARLRPRRVLEIGTARGGTLWAWCQVAADDATIVSLDLPGGPFAGGHYDTDKFHTYVRPAQRLTLIRDDSHSSDVRGEVAAAFDGPVDFLFIDGDHTYEGARMDFEMYAPLVRPGGIVAFHDIIEHRPETGCEAHRFWHEVKGDYQHIEFVDPSDDRGWGPWGGIGVLTMARPKESPSAE